MLEIQMNHPDVLFSKPTPLDDLGLTNENAALRHLTNTLLAISAQVALNIQPHLAGTPDDSPPDLIQQIELTACLAAFHGAWTQTAKMLGDTAS